MTFAPFSVGPSPLQGLENPSIVSLSSGPCIVVLTFVYINSVAAPGPSQYIYIMGGDGTSATRARHDQ